MSTDRERLTAEGKRMRVEYGELFAAVSGVLFRHDPIEINFGVNTDEYDSEAETILPRLGSCHSEADVLRVVHEEFMRWFDRESVGPVERYGEMAREIWGHWREFDRG
ncbi:hypothetical protein OKA05_27315 [Luteolibacter arcticus]|uniref:Uncharacterized protein n=1 Tax=Luteolibacter arcticus TaxID=1581411 RepID=A0ABT3GRY6_9BACT|nr:hypothetical protein [Luteolibacter arcticus]MCW1926294.1 hypothetical protein [Luteolibacter arcticus]